MEIILMDFCPSIFLTKELKIILSPECEPASTSHDFSLNLIITFQDKETTIRKAGGIA